MKVLFCDVEGVWRIFAGRNSFVMQIQCGELLLEVCIVMWTQVENCCRKIFFCDVEPLLVTVAGSYYL